MGYLLYLTTSMPDIILSVYICAHFQSDPKESHLTVVKKILRYLAGTVELTLWYPRDTCFDLIGYSSADFTGSRVEKKTPLEHINSLELLYFHGIAKRNCQLAGQLLKLNTFLLGVV